MYRSLLLGCFKERVVFRFAPVSLVARHGRVLERFRFRSPAGSERAPEHAFQQLGLTDSASENEFSEMEFEGVSDFFEICAEMLSVYAWRLVDYGRFVRDEDISLLEARSVLGLVQCACERRRNVRIRFLLENLALVLPLTKRRSRSFPGVFTQATELVLGDFPDASSSARRAALSAR